MTSRAAGRGQLAHKVGTSKHVRSVFGATKSEGSRVEEEKALLASFQATYFLHILLFKIYLIVALKLIP